MLLLQQMIVLFLLMLIGFFCYKKEVITDEVSKKISAIVVNIANPAMILSGGMDDSGVIAGKELITVLIIIAVMYTVLVLLGQLMPKLLRVDLKSRGAYQAMTIFSNIGFMGFPVIAALYGNQALLYGALFTIPYNLLIYTYGVSVMEISQEEGKKEKKQFPWNRVLNTGVIACLVTMVLYFGRIPVPAFLKAAVTSLSNLTAPLSMMVIGASLAVIDLKKLFGDMRLLAFSVIKLLLIPIVGTLIIKQFINHEMIVGVCMVMLATPVGSMTAMLAQQYEGDYEMTVRGVALTTILSVVTMPVVALIVG